jgi:RNA polymerase sigma factor (sigma-70 family)
MLSGRDVLLDELEELYRRRHHVFVRVARAITGDPDAAADAVQEGFADAIRSRRTYRRETPLEGWVWSVVVNAARRSLRPREDALADAHALEQPPQAVSIQLAPLISALPERQRIAIFLRYYGDLDYRSIAAALGIEVGTVSATLASAHRTIRHALEEVAHHA